MNPNKNYIGAGLLALAFIGAWGWTLPEYNKISELDMAINERQDLYDTRGAIIKKVGDLNKEYQQNAADISKISSLLPSNKSLAEAVSAIDKMAIQSGIQLINTTIVGQESNSQVGDYNLLPIEITMNGSYTGLVALLQSIEKNLRIIDITSINATNASGNPGLLNLLIKGNTYYLK